MSFALDESISPQQQKSLSSTLVVPVLICLVGALFYSYEYLLRILPSVINPQLMDHFAIRAHTLGHINAFYYYAYVPMQLPVGLLMDRYGPRFLLALACLLCVAGTYLFVATDSVTVACVARFIVGFGSAFAFVGVLKLATIWLPSNMFAMCAGLAAALGTVGAMTGDILLTHLSQKMGWVSTVNYAAIIGIFLAVLVWAVVRDKKPTLHRSHEHPPAADFKQLLRELFLILKKPQMWVIGLIGCLIYLPTTVFAEQWGIMYLEQSKHLIPTHAALGNTMLFLGFTIFAPISGWLSDKLHSRRKPLLIGALGATLFMLIIIYVPNLSETTVYALMFMLGAMYSSQAIVFAVAREICPASVAATAIATTNMLVMLGGILFQPLVGDVLDFVQGNIPNALHLYSTYDFKWALAILPVGIFISAVLVFSLRESHPKNSGKLITG